MPGRRRPYGQFSSYIPPFADCVLPLLGDLSYKSFKSSQRDRECPSDSPTLIAQHAGSNSVKAIVIHAPKDLRYEDVASPPLGANGMRVKIEIGGICGSDLHYYRHGGFGAVRLRHPMVLGHEIAWVVVGAGPRGQSLRPGPRVARHS